MSNLPLFDRQASEAAKDAGMALAAGNKQSLLEYAQELAVELARSNGEVTADDVVEQMHLRRGIEPGSLGNASGSIFKTGQFMIVGYSRARRVKSHGRVIARWRLK
jgi:hypothetical protein